MLDKAANRMRWPVVVLLSLGMVIAYFDRVNLSVALPSMSEGFGWTETQQGMALSAIFWTYTLLQIPSGYLVDRFGVRTPYLIGFLIWSIASAATALTAGLAALVAIRWLVGIGESVVTPASMRYIRLHFDEKNRGSAVGLYMAGTKVGPALGMPVSAYLVAEYGWQPMFIIIGLVSLVWLLPWMLWVKKDDVAAQPGSSAAVKRAVGGQSVSTSAIVKSPVIWGTILGTFCYMYFVYYCMTWMPTYFKQQHGMSIKEMGWYGGVSFGGMALVAVTAGWAADALIRRGRDPVAVRKGFTIAGLLAASTQTLGAYTTDTNLMLLFAVFSLCGLGLATANYWALTQTLIPGGSIALVVGIQNTAANLPGIVAPWLTGWLIERTGAFDAPIKTVGVWLALGIASYLFLVREKYAPKPSTGDPALVSSAES